MAGEITQTELQNAKLDAITLAQAVTTNATITPRTGSAFSSIPKLVADKGADLDAETANAAAWATSLTVVADGLRGSRYYAQEAAASAAAIGERYIGEFANDALAEAAASSSGTLAASDEYFNTTDNRRRVYDGTNWYEPGAPAVTVSVANGGTGASTSAGARTNLVPNRILNVIDDFGAVADEIELASASVSSGSTALTRNNHGLTSADVGKAISVSGAGTGGENLSTTIAAIADANTITLDDAASTTASSVRIVIGTDNSTAFQSALDSGNFVRVPAGRYLITTQLTWSDGSKLKGDGGFFRPRAGYVYNDHNPAVIVWGGDTGSNACPLRVSALAIGTEATDLSAPGTDDLLDFRLEDIHVDAFGADFGVYYYRCGAHSYVHNITVEGASVAGQAGWGLFSALWGVLGAFANAGKGFIFGVPYAPVTTGWGAGEITCFSCHMDLFTQKNGTDETFVKDTGTDEDGCGALLGFGRGSQISVSSEGNFGRAFVITQTANDAPAFYEMRYVEANEAGPKVNYDADTKAVRLRDAFVHPGNGGSLEPQTIDIVADVDDGGPTDYHDYLEISGCFGDGFAINSNTSKFRVTDSEDSVVFDDRYPSADDQSRDAPDALINGQFAVWQRGTSFTATGKTADRWDLALSTATGSLTRQALTPGDLPGVDAPSPPYFARLQTTVSATNVGLQQFIPDARTYAGRSVYVSFWAKLAAARDVRVILTQAFGTGGSPSASVAKVVDVAVGTAWRRYVARFDLDSVAGKSFGTNGDSSLALVIRITNDALFTLDLAAVQIDAGGLAPRSFRLRSSEEEASRCYPFFQRLCSGSLFRPIAGAGQCVSGTSTSFSLGFPAPMRKTPTLAVSSVGHFAVSGNTGADITATSIALTAARTNQFGGELIIGVASGLSAGDASTLRSTNASATMDLDAEL